MKTRQSQFTWAVRALHQENRRQKVLPNGTTEHWGWIPVKHDRVKILKQIGRFAEETHRPKYVVHMPLLTLALHCRITSKPFPSIHPTIQIL